MDDKEFPMVANTQLIALHNRLEAATSRLEDMAASVIDLPTINGAPAPAPTGPLPPPPARAPVQAPKPVVESVPESVEEFDTFLNGAVKKFLDLSEGIGGPISEQVFLNGYTRDEFWLTECTGCACVSSLRLSTEIHPHYYESEEA